MIKININFLLLSLFSTCIFVEGNNFEWDLVKKSLSTNTENAVVSPFSIEIVLSVLAEALDHESNAFKEMVTFMPNIQNYHRFRRNMRACLETSSTSDDLKLATRFFLRKGFEIDNAYRKIVESYYKVDVMNLDFEKRNEATQIINNWVDAATGGNIPKLVDPKDIDSQMAAIIINAIYFKSDWKYPFMDTDHSKFYLDSGETIENVNYMDQTNNFSYYESSSIHAKILSMPFINEKFSMYFIMPSNGRKINDFIQRINSETIEHLESNMTEETVVVKLPKFDFTYSTDVKQILEELHMNKLFSEKKFPGLGESEFEIKKIIQKAGIAINEKGAEAYAATQVDIGERSISGGGFLARRSFLFYIKDNENKKVYFAGKFSKPN